MPLREPPYPPCEKTRGTSQDFITDVLLKNICLFLNSAMLAVTDANRYVLCNRTIALVRYFSCSRARRPLSVISATDTIVSLLFFLSLTAYHNLRDLSSVFTLTFCGIISCCFVIENLVYLVHVRVLSQGGDTVVAQHIFDLGV